MVTELRAAAAIDGLAGHVASEEMLAQEETWVAIYPAPAQASVQPTLRARALHGGEESSIAAAVIVFGGLLICLLISFTALVVII